MPSCGGGCLSGVRNLFQRNKRDRGVKDLSAAKRSKLSEAVKNEVARAVAAYTAHLRRGAQDQIDSEENRWASAWTEVLNHAVLAAQEGFMTSAAKSDIFVGSCIAAYMEAEGQEVPKVPAGSTPIPVQVVGDLTRQQLERYYKRASTSQVRCFSEAELEQIFTFFDTDHDERISFGEFVTMQFVPMYLSVQSQAFPTPLGVALKPELAMKGLDILAAGDFQCVLGVQLAAYADRLRKQVQETSSVHIAGRTSIMSLSGAQDLALKMALIESQVNFMAVLLLANQSSPSVAAACERWKAFQIGTFMSFDTNGDGKLDAAELATCMEQSVKETLTLSGAGDIGIDFLGMSTHFLQSFDIDSDGEISMSEWLLSCAAFDSTFLLSSFYEATLPEKQAYMPLPSKELSADGASTLSLVPRAVMQFALSANNKGFFGEASLPNAGAANPAGGRSALHTPNPNPFSVPGKRSTVAGDSLGLVPTPQMKAQALRAVMIYNARLRQKAESHARSPEMRWAQAWSEVVSHAVLAAQESFMNSAVMSDTFVSNLVQAFMEVRGTAGKRAAIDLEAELDLEQVKAFFSDSSFASDGWKEHEVEEAFEHVDVNASNGLSFGQFVTMQFVPLYLSVQSQAFPTPEGVVSMQVVTNAGCDSLTREFQAAVEDVLEHYAKRLREQARHQGNIEIVGRTGILAFTGEKEVALSLPLVEAQVGFMSVLLCGDRGNAEVAAACEQWKAFEVGNFIRFDEDKNGELDASELAKCLERSIVEGMPFIDMESVDFESMASHFLACFDVNANGSISAAEWLVSSAAFQSTFLVATYYKAALPHREPHVPVPVISAPPSPSRSSRPGSPAKGSEAPSSPMLSPTGRGFNRPSLLPRRLTSRLGAAV